MSKFLKVITKQASGPLKTHQHERDLKMVDSSSHHVHGRYFEEAYVQKEWFLCIKLSVKLILKIT